MTEAEQDILAEIETRLTNHGVRWWPSALPPTSWRGYPELAGVRHDGRMFAVKVVLPGRDLAADAATWMAYLVGRNVHVVLARSVDDVGILLPPGME